MNKVDAPNYLQKAVTIARLFQSDVLTTSDVCQFLAMSVFPKSPPKGVGIFEIHANNTYSATSHFGFDDGLHANWQGVSLATKTPVVDSMRTGEIIVVETLDQMNVLYPITSHLSPAEHYYPLVAVPLKKVGFTIGALGLLGSESTTSDDCLMFLRLVGELISIKLIADTIALESLVVKDEIKNASKVLTDREQAIQLRMAQGKTKRTISEELGYSESTIRQDAVSLFAKLSVSTRPEAGDKYSAE